MAARASTIGAAAIVAFAAGLLLARAFVGPAEGPPLTLQATAFPAARAIPRLDLMDQDGAPMNTDFFRQGWTLVFFGFTSCPDICPTTLATLVQVTNRLQDLPAAERPRVLMISVDPERDNPVQLGNYLRFFDPSFLGATGTEAAITRAAETFGVPFARVDLPEGGYTMDHGSGIFIVAPSGGVVAYSSAPHDAAVLASDYRSLVTHFGR